MDHESAVLSSPEDTDIEFGCVDGSPEDTNIERVCMYTQTLSMYVIVYHTMSVCMIQTLSVCRH